ncbi:MAG: hypothetical protein AAFX10_01235, partial [Pseudomonadota bacterium]
MTRRRNVGATLLLAGATLALAGCGANAQRGAAEGGATGAVAGAVGGMVTALVFGGNIAEAGARGAVAGGATGATVGAMAGSKRDSAEKARREAERQQKLKVLEQDLGPDAYNGIVALTECKYGVAIANAQEARTSSNKEYALAGVWVETLAEMDRDNEQAAAELFETLASQ